MVVWGLTIFAMCGLILAIGYKTQDKEYLSLTSDLKEVATKYVKDKKISIKFNESSVVFVKDLINEEYIDDNKKIDEYCIKSVVLRKTLFSYKYTINIDCEKEEEVEEE